MFRTFKILRNVAGFWTWDKIKVTLPVDTHVYTITILLVGPLALYSKVLNVSFTNVFLGGVAGPNVGVWPCKGLTPRKLAFDFIEINKCMLCGFWCLSATPYEHSCNKPIFKIIFGRRLCKQYVARTESGLKFLCKYRMHAYVCLLNLASWILKPTIL